MQLYGDYIHVHSLNWTAGLFLKLKVQHYISILGITGVIVWGVRYVIVTCMQHGIYKFITLKAWGYSTQVFQGSLAGSLLMLHWVCQLQITATVVTDTCSSNKFIIMCFSTWIINKQGGKYDSPVTTCDIHM